LTWVIEFSSGQTLAFGVRFVLSLKALDLLASLDYNIRELALYDLPAAIAHVKKETGYDKV
jgi:hypothetical protein